MPQKKVVKRKIKVDERIIKGRFYFKEMNRVPLKDDYFYLMFKMAHKIVIGLLVSFFFLGCSSQNEVEKSIYHWETNFNLTPAEEDFLVENQMNKVYAKFFDLKVDGNKDVIPVADILFANPPKQEIIPVVYITTDVFYALDSVSIKKLALNTYKRIQKLHPTGEFGEIQIDCDWTAGIQSKYFYFLTCLKAEMEDKQLSCTVRLYQYKYPDITGTPPVDNGVLMYYNMGDLRRYDESNSILNNETGKLYLGFGSYPIPLDFALPNFEWSLHYRYGEFKQIISTIGYDQLQDTALFEKKANQYYQVKKDTLMGTNYLRLGDELRFETCSEAALIEAAQLLRNEKNKSTTTLLFYSLNPSIANETAKINHVLTAFK